MTDTMTLPEARVSEERLREVYRPGSNGGPWGGEFDLDEIAAIVTELLALRSSTPEPVAWQDMSCDEQLTLATRIAANVGYVLKPEPEIDPLPPEPSQDLERVEIPMDQRGDFPDGIAVRDVTIEQLESELATLSPTKQGEPG